MMKLTEHVETRRLKVDGTNWTGAANTTDLTSEVVDTKGFDGVRFLIGFGTITAGAVTSIKVQESANADGSSAADLAGSAQTVADDADNKVFISEIYRPQKRYLVFFLDRGTQNAVVDFLMAELFAKVGKTPITQHATIGGVETFASPDEGTA